jgi:biotin-dependent carboxylase-like uncharacterized protein
VSTLSVLRPGSFTSVQDLGRPRLACLGVARSGALDRASFALANRLVGNPRSAAALEVTLGGLALRADDPVYVAVTGADVPLLVDGVVRVVNTAFWLQPGQVLEMGVARRGVRSYLAVRGGIDVPAALGSRSRDVLAGLGPEPLAAGDRLPVGVEREAFPAVDVAPVSPRGSEEELLVEYVPGPRDDWFGPEAIKVLESTRWVIDTASNRIGVRLNGPTLSRTVTDELPSEGMPIGAIQVPPAGPVVFLNDHPVTGGYPVIGVVRRSFLDHIAQLRPGEVLRFSSRPAR